MLKLAQYLGSALTSMGATVKYTRTTNAQNPSIEERGRMGAGADLFVSLHTNAADDPEARGVITYYSIQQPQNRGFAVSLGEAIANTMGNQFRGAETRTLPSNPNLDYYGVIRSSVAAGAKISFLLEQGFHTNPEDCAFLSNEANLKKLAMTEARVIGEYLGLRPTPAPTPPGCVFYYTVQPGEYLYIIGKKFGVPWQTIAAANGLTEPYIIQPGERLIIPMPTA